MDNEKNPQLPLKRKKKSTLSACLGSWVGCMKLLIPKEFVTIFGLGNAPC